MMKHAVPVDWLWAMKLHAARVDCSWPVPKTKANQSDPVGWGGGGNGKMQGMMRWQKACEETIGERGCMKEL